MKESNTRYSVTYKSLKQITFLITLSSFIPFDLRLFSLLVALLLPLVLTCKYILLSFHSCFVEQSPIFSTSRCSSHHSFTYIKLTCLWSFSLFLFLFHCSFASSTVFIWHLRYWPSFVYSHYTHFTIIQPHLHSFYCCPGLIILY